jgi:hypothetical protein
LPPADYRGVRTAPFLDQPPDNFHGCFYVELMASMLEA